MIALTLLAVLPSLGAPAGEVRVVATVDVGAAPHGIRFSPDGRRAFVAVSGDGEVAVLDCESLAVLERLPAGEAPLDVVLLADGSPVVTQFRGTSLVFPRSPDAPELQVGAGPSLFAPRVLDGRAYLACEHADVLIVLDTRAGVVRDRFPTGDRPYPADVTRDGVLAFVPNRDDGTVSVIDLLNRETAATVAVGELPEGGALTEDDTSYVVACGGSNELVWVNTASYEVVHRLSEGVGPRPFSVATVPGGRLALVNNAGGRTVTVLDLEARALVGEVEVGEQPIVVRVHPDGRRAFVSNEVSGTVSVLALPVEERPAPEPFRKSEVLVLGTIHGGHRTSERYSLDLLRRLVTEIDPDFVLAEIPPNRAGAAMAGFRRDGEVTEPRVARFPEYVDVIYPLTRELDFELAPTAAWTEPMARFRRERLAAIAADPERAAEWEQYQAGEAASEACAAEAGEPDDPAFVNSAAYDRCAELALEPYDRLFNDELGPGGWTSVNRGHWANIARALDRRAGEGKRFLVTYGAGHKGWFLRELRRRDDVVLLELGPFLERVRGDG